MTGLRPTAAPGTLPGKDAAQIKAALHEFRTLRHRAPTVPASGTPFDPVAQLWPIVFPHLSPDIARVVLGAWLANDQKLGYRDPCWLTVIAPSSSAKTDILMALAHATDAYVLDSLSPNTLISGLRLGDGSAPAKGLLRELGPRPRIVIKDLSVILTKNAKDRQEIIGQLRAVYDGEYGRPTGTGGDDKVARWRGRATLMVGMTPAIDIYHALNNQLGERFVQLRFEIPEADVVAVAGQALENEEEGRDARAILAAPFMRALVLARPFLRRDALGPGMRLRLQNLVAFVTKARAGVMRNSDNFLVQEPAPEGPGRLVKQLAALACGLAALRGTPHVTEADYQLVERVAFNSIPQPRSKILWRLYDKGACLVGDLLGHVRLTPPTVRRHLDDLVLVGLADVARAKDQDAHTYRPSALGTKYLAAARGEQPAEGSGAKAA